MNPDELDAVLSSSALRLLGHFWLNEVRREDALALAALPVLAEGLPEPTPQALTGLAVEYQRLFGFGLPPYESLFLDPAAMLNAPATARLQALYRRSGWQPPAEARAAAVDHLGLELLALADFIGAASSQERRVNPGPFQRLLAEHLSLWVPPLVSALRRLAPQPFYAGLGELTLDLVLALLQALPLGLLSDGEDPFPVLPPPPVYRGSEEPGRPEVGQLEGGEDSAGRPVEADLGLNEMVRRLLTPCQAGLFLSRGDIARLSQALDLPAGGMGERFGMLRTLFELAGQYELAPALVEGLGQLFDQAQADYQAAAGAYPAWGGYARAWQGRLDASRAVLESANLR